MIEFIRFGLIDNGVLIALGLIGVSLEKPIENGLNYLLKRTKVIIKSRSSAKFGLFCGGIANAVSDFMGGLGISWGASYGTFLGCMVIVIIAIPFVFKINRVR